MKKVYKLENLDCANCTSKIEQAAKKIDGIESINISFMTQRMTLEADENKLETILAELQKLMTKIEPGVLIKI